MSKKAFPCASDVGLARKQLARLASSLRTKHPGAVASVREGLDETLAVRALGIAGSAVRTLRTTNPIENLDISVARHRRILKLHGRSQMRTLLKALEARRCDTDNGTARKAALHVQPRHRHRSRFSRVRDIAAAFVECCSRRLTNLQFCFSTQRRPDFRLHGLAVPGWLEASDSPLARCMSLAQWKGWGNAARVAEG